MSKTFEKYKVGDKLRIKTEYIRYCGSMNSTRKEIEYVEVVRIMSSGSYRYQAYDKNGKKLKECFGCLGDQHLEYYKQTNQGEFNMSQNNYKLGDVLDLKDTKTLVQISNEPHSELKNGDLFVNVNASNGIKKGEIVSLYRNDGSDCPFFGTTLNDSTCLSWGDLAHLPEGSATNSKPEVTGISTYYSDGVKVTPTHVEFDGRNWEREALAAAIKRYTEVLKRPVAQVPVVPPAPKRVRKPAPKTVKKA